MTRLSHTQQVKPSDSRAQALANVSSEIVTNELGMTFVPVQIPRYHELVTKLEEKKVTYIYYL